MDSEPTDRVLIVDDDEDARPALERSLRRLGYEVASAADGEEGLRMAIALPPSVILADLRMPKMDGHTLLRRLKAQDLDAAVVVMSGHGTMDDVVDALRNGAVDYLKKPWTASELGAAVGRAVEVAGKRRAFRSSQAAAPARAPASPGTPAPAPVSSPAMPAIAPGAQAPSTSAPATNPSSVAPAFVSSPGVPRAAASAPAGAKSLLRSVLQRLSSGEQTLPVIPAVLVQLRELIHQPDASIDKVVQLIEQDARTQAQVIRLANSVQYSGLTRVSELRAAVNRVGFRQIENIVESSFAQACCRISTDARFQPMQLKVWRYSVARGVSMRALAEQAGAPSGLNPAIAYLAGLMSDSGATFLLWLTAERERTAHSGNDVAMLADCRAMIRDHHQELGAMVMRSWGMDDAVVFVAKHHHDEAPPEPHNPYWGLSVLASDLADQLAPGDDITRVTPLNPMLLERCAAELHLQPGLMKRSLARLKREMDAIFETLA